jgi:hypothetical protein
MATGDRMARAPVAGLPAGRVAAGRAVAIKWAAAADEAQGLTAP